MPPFLLACLAYLSVALPSSTLGLLWPSMRLSFGEPVGALGVLLVFGITASVISSAATGRVPVRTATLVAIGPIAERLGPSRVLTVAVAGIPAGAALMTAPGPGLLAIIGLMTLGLAAAPVFPLLTLMSPQWTGSATGATRMVSLQVAASAIGSAALSAGLGLAIGAVNARILAPSLLILGLAMGGLYVFGSRWSGRAVACRPANSHRRLCANRSPETRAGSMRRWRTRP